VERFERYSRHKRWVEPGGNLAHRAFRPSSFKIFPTEEPQDAVWSQTIPVCRFFWRVCLRPKMPFWQWFPRAHNRIKWRLLAKLVDQTKLREDICDIDARKIQGWVLMNVKFATECINGDANDFNENDYAKRRGYIRMTPEGPYSYWDILPLSTYQPP